MRDLRVVVDEVPQVDAAEEIALQDNLAFISGHCELIDAPELTGRYARLMARPNDGAIRLVMPRTAIATRSPG